jgi:zinc transport system substrate-binding protein
MRRISARVKKSLIPALLVVSILITAAISGCSEQDNSKLKVVTSTSLIAQIVERIGGDKVDVVNIIPPGQCPGHFDCTPGDIQKLADADLFLLHGWQGEKFSEELIATADNEKLISIQVNAKVGENMNWMTPPVQSAAVDKIADALAQVDEANSGEYREAADKYKEQIAEEETEIREKLATINPGGVNALCADQQAGFVDWAGFNIVDIFGRPETLTPQVVKDLVDEGRAGNVVLIIDNMQSGADAGAGIAEELACNRVILSNFPGGYENTSTWEDTIEYNVELLIEALK